MRPIVAGTIARGELREDDHLYRGMKGGDWETTNALPVTSTLLDRGRQRFGIYCAPCHGLAGAGDGMVARRADQLAEGTWTPPSSLHTDLVRQRPDGYLFNVVTNGVRNMPAYGSQIGIGDRWAIVAYIRALQRSQRATIEDVPPDVRPTLR
jgi:mono/diheme cytochrome c family protein